MSEIKLSDQLGAMAIIDELYHQQIALEELLNPSVLRDKIAQSVKQYYQSKGMDIDDALIEKGVNQWFADRLRFQMAKPAWHQRLLAKFYINRNILIIVCLLGVIAWGGYATLTSYTEKWAQQALVAKQEAEKQAFIERQKAAELALAEKQKEKQVLVSNLTGYLKEFESLNNNGLRYASDAGKALRLEADKLFVQLVDKTRSFDLTANQSNSADSSAESILAKLTSTYQSIAADSKAIGDSLASYKSLLNNDRRIQQIADVKNFNSLYQSYLPFRKAFDNATLALSSGAANAESEIAVLETSYQQLLEVQKITRQGSDTVALLKKSVLRKDQPEIDSVASEMTQSLSQFQLSEAKAALSHLEYLYQLSQADLTLLIVDQVGEKSGVERTYDDSGGKTWYLIVEAKTAQGRAFPLRLTDSETGKMATVTRFGIQVPVSEYNKVRSDKRDNGHIDNPTVGKKSPGRLAFSYSRSTDGKIIMEW